MDFFFQYGYFGYGLIVLLGIVISVIGIPQTFYQLFLGQLLLILNIIGFTIRRLFLAFILNSTMILISSIIQFFVAKHLLRERLLSYFENQQVFKIFQLLIEGNQKQDSCLDIDLEKPIKEQTKLIEREAGNWQNIVLIRFLYLPTFVKNYGIPLFNISFKMFILTSFPIDAATGMLLVYIGQTASNIEELMTSNQQKFQRYLLIAILGASVFIIGYIAWYTNKKIKKLKETEDWTIKLISKSQSSVNLQQLETKKKEKEQQISEISTQ